VLPSNSCYKSVAGFDLGTHYGFATRSSDGVISAGSCDLCSKRTTSPGYRYLQFEGHIRAVFSNNKTEIVFYEEVRSHSGVQAAHVYGGFEATLLRVCDEVGISYCSVPVGVVKKVGTGSGNAGKETMLGSAKIYLPNITDHNAADAFWVMVAGITTGLNEENIWTTHLSTTTPPKRRKRSGSALS
jgi:Holliday junction resolvasome RuvABC endonuclease subunit